MRCLSLDASLLAPTACAREQETGVVATRNAIRRTIRREAHWRRRGGVVVLLALLSKSTNDVSRTQQDATATAPASRTCDPSSGDTDNVTNLARFFEDEGGSPAGEGRCSLDAKYACPAMLPLPYGSDNRDIADGEEAARKKRSMPISDLLLNEEEKSGGGTDEKLVGALAGLMDLGWGNEDISSLFRKIVMYL